MSIEKEQLAEEIKQKWLSKIGNLKLDKKKISKTIQKFYGKEDTEVTVICVKSPKEAQDLAWKLKKKRSFGLENKEMANIDKFKNILWVSSEYSLASEWYGEAIGDRVMAVYGQVDSQLFIEITGSNK